MIRSAHCCANVKGISLPKQEDIHLAQMAEAVRAAGFPEIRVRASDPSGLVFEERVKMACFYCGRYRSCWTCPPRIPDIDYPKMFSEFENGAFVWVDMPYTEEDYREVRRESSVRLHRALLFMERWLWDRDRPLALSFTAGSCKLCKNGCGKDRCNNPYMARTPLEATGCNVVESAARAGIQISFPPSGSLMRLGFLVW